jgi:hypothetical protein
MQKTKVPPPPPLAIGFRLLAIADPIGPPAIDSPAPDPAFFRFEVFQLPVYGLPNLNTSK